MDTFGAAQSFESLLAAELARLEKQGLLREMRRIDSPQGPRISVLGQSWLNFSSNDYLGLASHPLVRDAAREAVAKFGSGAGASRLICGSLAPHHELEEAIARFKKTPAALAFGSGWAAAHGAIGALLGKNDIIVLDRLVHASIVDAARLCGARIRVFPHQDLEALARILLWANAGRSSPASRVLVVTESLFSMDGDYAPLREIADLKDRYGAWLMVDEAHSTGLYGSSGSGLVDAHGLRGRVEVQMGTLGKALGAAGGFICGARPLIDLLVNKARSFIFSTAPVPAAAAAAMAALELAQGTEGEDRRESLRGRVAQLRSGLARSGGSSSETHWQFPPSAPIQSGGATASHPAFDLPASAIVPLIVGSEERALAIAAALRSRSFLIPAIRYPTVARGRARLRVTLTAAHEAADVDLLIGALQAVGTGL
jgi:8-amino-7-oxononanoate synthase